MFRAAVTGILIAVFFVLHNLGINRGLLEVNDILLLLLFTCVCIVAFFYVSFFLFRSRGKASVFTTWVTILFLFFGNIQDGLSELTLAGRFTGMKYFLPACLLSVFLLYFFLYRSKRTFIRSTAFLFTLGTFLITYECVLLLWMPADEKPNDFVIKQKGQINGRCNNCKQPDIYFLLLDEYTGADGLKNDFQYDNGWFESMLQERQFTTISGARSPYILTIYAMASMLNSKHMTDTLRQKISNNLDYQYALRAINNNMVCHLLADKGYAIRNFSPFDIPNAPSSFSETFNPSGVRLLYYKTFYGRLKRDLPFILRGKNLTTWNKAFNERLLSNNQVALKETLKTNNSATPWFTYTHLFMPHAPFAFDSTGKMIPPAVGRTPKQDCDDYLQYLVYTNKMLINYLDELKRNTKGNAVILIASDHGYRAGCATLPSTAEHSVLMSYYLPAGVGNIQDVPGASNVQAFQLLFKAIFGN